MCSFTGGVPQECTRCFYCCECPTEGAYALDTANNEGGLFAQHHHPPAVVFMLGWLKAWWVCKQAFSVPWKCPGTTVLCVVSHWMQCSVWHNTLLNLYFGSLRVRELSQIRISSLPCCAVHHDDISKEAPVIAEVERVILHSLEMSRLHFTEGLRLQIHSLNWATCYLHGSCVLRVSSEHSRQLRKSGTPCAGRYLTPLRLWEDRSRCSGKREGMCFESSNERMWFDS